MRDIFGRFKPYNSIGIGSISRIKRDRHAVLITFYVVKPLRDDDWLPLTPPGFIARNVP